MGRFLINFLLYLLIFKTLAFGALGTPSYIYASDEQYSSRIIVEWSKVEGATYYYIDYKEPGKTTFSRKTFNASYDNSIYTNVFYTAKEGIYSFKICACDSSGCGSFTSEESGSIQPQNVPGDVSGVSATDGLYEDKVSVTWNAVDDATSYKILIHTPNDTTGVYSITKTSDSNSYEYSTSIQGTFYFKVQACNDAGCGNESSPDGGSIKAFMPPTQKPTNLIATDGDYQNVIKVTWSSVENSTYYKLFYKAPNGSDFQYLTTNDTFYYLETSTFGEYIFQVEGCNSDGCSPISDSEVGSIAEVVPSGVPTNLSASDGEYSGKIKLSWSSVTNATHYKIHIKVPNSETYSYDFSNINSFDYYTSVEGLHYFKVEACNGAGCSTLYSSEESGYIKVLPPTNPPTNINATNGVYSNKIKVSWSSVENTTSYRLYVKAPESSIYSSNYISVNSTFYDYETDINGAYYFKVKACNSGGCSSSYTNEVSGSIKEIILPSAPSNFSATKGTYKNKIYVEWSKVEGANKYIIYYKAPNSSSFNSVNYNVVYDGSLYSYPFSIYTEGTYTFKIQSCSDEGCGDESGEITGYIQPATVPEIPINLEVTNEIHENRIELDWEATLDTTSYKILIHKPSDENGVYSLTKTSKIDSYIYYTTEVGIHHFKVQACNDIGCSSLTSPVDGAIKGDIIPSKPLNLSATDGEYQDNITINWSKSDGATYYKLFVKKPNSSYYEIVNPNIIDNFYYYETSIKGDFYFKVQACNSAGCSTDSDIVSGFIANMPPTLAPINLSATKGYSDNYIKISWDSVSDATHYKLYIKKPNSTTYDYLFVDDIFYEYSTTLMGKHYFKVQACNGAGCASSYSSEVLGYTKLDTPLIAPLNLQASKGTKGSSIDINWDKVENATYYKLFYRKPNQSYYSPSNYFTTINNYYNFSTTLDGVFYFKVKSCKDEVCSENYSDEDSGYIEIKGLSEGIQNLNATKGGYFNKIEINWDLLNGIDCYKLSYKEPLSSSYKTLELICFDSGEKSGYYNFETTKSGNYSFKVAPCLDKDNCEESSSEVSGYIKELGKVSKLSASKGEYLNKIEINWAFINGIDCYKLYYYLNKNRIAPPIINYALLDFICFDGVLSDKFGYYDDGMMYYNFETTQSGNYYFKVAPCIDKDNCGETSSAVNGYIKQPSNFSPTISNINIPYSEYLKPSHFFIYLTKDEGLKSSDLTFYINSTKVTPLDIKDDDGLIVKLAFDKLSEGENRVSVKNDTKTIDIIVNTTITPFREAFENGGLSWSANVGAGQSLKFEFEFLGAKIGAESGISATLEATHKDGIDTVVIADSKGVGSLLYGIPVEDTLGAKVEATLLDIGGDRVESGNVGVKASVGNLEAGASCTLTRNIYPLNLKYPDKSEEIALFLIPYIGQQIIPSINSFAQIGLQIMKDKSELYKDIYIIDCSIGAGASLVKGDVSISSDSSEKDDEQIEGLSTTITVGEYQKLNRTAIISGVENGEKINLVRKYYSNYSKDDLKVLYFEYGIHKNEYIARVVFETPNSVKYSNLDASFDIKEVTYYLSESDYNALLSNLFDIDGFFNYKFSEPTLIQTKLNSKVNSVDLTLIKAEGAIVAEGGGEVRYNSKNYESVLYELAYKIGDKSYTIYENNDKTFRDVDLSKFYGSDLIVESFKNLDKEKLTEKLLDYLENLIGEPIRIIEEKIANGVYEIKNEAKQQIVKIKTVVKEVTSEVEEEAQKKVKVIVYEIEKLIYKDKRAESLQGNLNNANLTFISNIVGIEIDSENVGSEIYIYPQYGTLENTALFKYSTQKAKWEKVDSKQESDTLKFNIKESGLYAIIKDFVSSENDIFTQNTINIKPNETTTITSNQLKTILNSVATNRDFEVTLSDTFILSNESAIYGESPIDITSNIETNSNGELELSITSNSYEGEAIINIKSNEGYLADNLKVYVIKEDSLKPIENFKMDISLSKSDIVVGDSININVTANSNYIDEDISIISPNTQVIKSKSINLDKKGEWSVIVKLQDINGFWHEEKLTFEVKSSNSTTLNIGWNLKGNPLSVNLYTSDIKNLFGEGEYWIYNNEWIKNPSMIKPLQGFWIKSKLEKVIKFEDIDNLENEDEKITPLLSGWSLMGLNSEANLISLLYKFSANIIYTYQNNNWYNSNSNPNRLLNIGDGYWLKR